MKTRLFKEIVIFIAYLICIIPCAVMNNKGNLYEAMILNWIIRVWVELVWGKFNDEIN